MLGPLLMITAALLTVPPPSIGPVGLAPPSQQDGAEGGSLVLPELTATQRWPRRNTVPGAMQIASKPAIEFEGSTNIWGVTFSPDGQTLYAAIEGQGVDLWTAAVSVWKEILGLVVLLVVCGTVWLVGRVRGRAQTPGTPHCRRCNYNVTTQAPAAVLRGRARVRAAPGTHCPECGVDLHKRSPRRGRITLRRLAVPVLAAVAIVVMYTVMMAAGLPRSGRASAWFNIYSETVDAWTERYQLEGLIKHRGPVIKIVRLRTEDGTLLGMLTRRRGRGAHGIEISPCGSRLFVVGSNRDVACISTRWGIATTALRNIEFGLVLRESPIVCVDSQGDLLLARLRPETQRSELIRWRVSAGTVESVIDEPAYLHRLPTGDEVAVLRQYNVSATDGKVLYTSEPEMIQAYRESRTLDVYDQYGRLIRSLQLSEETHPILRSAVTSNGGKAFFVGSVNGGVIEFDLLTARKLGNLRPTSGQPSHQSVVLSHDDRLLFAADHLGVLVWDIQRRRWVGDLIRDHQYSTNSVLGFGLTPSPNGRWLASCVSRRLGRTATLTDAIELYDLAGLRNWINSDVRNDPLRPILEPAQ